MKKSLKQRISTWWYGDVYESDPNEDVYFIGIVKHPTSIWVHMVMDYLRKHMHLIIFGIIALFLLVLFGFRLNSINVGPFGFGLTDQRKEIPTTTPPGVNN